MHSFTSKDAVRERPPSQPPHGEKENQINQKGGIEVQQSQTLEIPSQVQLDTLPRISGKIPWPAYTVAFIEFCERFSYYGTVSVFTNFIQQPRPPGSSTGAGHSGQSGALGQGQRVASALVTFSQFFTNVSPLVSAYIADAHLGRFQTICVAIPIGLIGHAFLIVSALPVVLDHSQTALAIFCVGLVAVSLGTGAFKSNVSVMISEQYSETIHVITQPKTNQQVIVDPALTTSRMYLYFYLIMSLGSCGQIAMAYCEKYVGFWLAYTLPLIVLLFTPLVMFAMRKRYTRIPAGGPTMKRALQVIVLCSRGRIDCNPWKTYQNFKASDFWDTAKPSRFQADREPMPAWMDFDDQYVDELRRAIKACQGFSLGFNNWTSQAATMELNGVPNDMISNLDPLTLIVCIPIFDLVIYPYLAKHRIRFTPIRRITLGFFTCSLAVLWSTVIQYYIYQTSPCGSYPSTCAKPAPLNVWIQSGQYCLLAISEIFASITGLEYAYNKAPKSMRSIVMAIFLLTVAGGSAIGQAFVGISVDPYLVWMYGFVTVLCLFGGIAFWFSFRGLDVQEDELNMVGVDMNS